MLRSVLSKIPSVAALMTCALTLSVLDAGQSLAGMSPRDIRRNLEEGATWIDPASLVGQAFWIAELDGGYIAFLDKDGVLPFTRGWGKPTVVSTWKTRPVSGGPTELCLNLIERQDCGPVLRFKSGSTSWFFKFERGRDDFPLARVTIEPGKPKAIIEGEQIATEQEALKARGVSPEDLDLLKALYLVFRIAEVCEDTGYHFTQTHLDEMTSLGQAIGAKINDAAEADKAWAGAVKESDALIDMMAASGRAKTYEACKQRLQWWVLFKDGLKQQYEVITPVPRNPF